MFDSRFAHGHACCVTVAAVSNDSVEQWQQFLALLEPLVFAGRLGLDEFDLIVDAYGADHDLVAAAEALAAITPAD